MEPETPAPVAERSYPLGFILIPAFIGGLVWLMAMLGRLGP
jgi:hypothetical protein